MTQSSRNFIRYWLPEILWMCFVFWMSIEEFSSQNTFSLVETILRTWFVAYGIGGPILFMTQASLRAKLVAAPNGWLIGILFLAGLAVQVFESFLYKMTTLHLYRGEVENDIKSCCTYAFSEWVERNYWIDIILDLATFALFAYATILAFPTVMGNP